MTDPKRVLSTEEVACIRHNLTVPGRLVSRDLGVALCDTCDMLREALRPFADAWTRLVASDARALLAEDRKANAQGGPVANGGEKGTEVANGD